MPLFGKKKKAETSAEEGGKGDATSPEAAKHEKKKSTPSSAEKAGPGRRTVAKPTSEVKQKNTQVLYRLNYAVKQHPNEPSRSAELVPLTKEFEYMRKNIRSLLTATKKYQKAMGEVAKARSEVYGCTAKIAEGTPLADVLASKKVVLGESLVTLDGKLIKADEQASEDYQGKIIDYVTEWEAILTKKIESELKYTQKQAKNLKHYEMKVEKLRKTVAAKEEKGKPTPQMTEKLARNEEKLKETHEEYEKTATKTCHLLEEATKKGWKDFHPLVQAMLVWESNRAADEQALFKQVDDIKNKVAHLAERLDGPLPAEAFVEVVLVSRLTTDSDDLENSGDSEASDEELD